MLIAGATGLIGRELVAQALADGEPVIALVRRKPPHAAPAVDWRLVDFARLPAQPTLPQGLSAPTAASDAAYCALGTTIKVAGSQAAFRAVDHDAVLAFAQVARSAGVTRLAVVSALGADARSANFYSRTKGEVEAALRGMGLERLVIARPSLLAGDRRSLGQPGRLGERLALAATKPLAGLIPLAWRPIEAATVARAMRRALAAEGPAVQVLESAALQRLGR